MLGQEFEAVSIKPNKSGDYSSHTNSNQGRLTATNVTLRSLIVMAYDIKDYQLEGPDFIRDERFDISAKMPDAPRMKAEEHDAMLHAMMRKMLEDRFKLEIHRTSKSFTVYALVVDKKGIKFKEVPDSNSHNSNSNNTHYVGTCVSMDAFAGFLARRVDKPVLDMTGLTKFYDMKLDWSQDESAADAVTLPVALQEQLGLKLDLRKAPIEVIVVDKIEKQPTEN